MILKHCPDHAPSEVRAALLRGAELLAKDAPVVKKKAKTATGKSSIKGLTLFSDGASRGNPGEAGAGYALLDDSGIEVGNGGKYLGQCTNNVAEYKALLLGLAAARTLGDQHLNVRLDSELIVKQLKGQYRVKNETLKPLFAQAKQALAAFASFTVQHVPRAQNKRADELANEAIDNK